MYDNTPSFCNLDIFCTNKGMFLVHFKFSKFDTCQIPSRKLVKYRRVGDIVPFVLMVPLRNLP